MKKQTMKGTVRWFDKSSGTGCITGEDSSSYRVYACNIIGAKSMFEHLACMYLEKGAEVEFAPVDGCGACYVTNGIFDSEHWDRIKDKDHAFTMREDGSFSGLFSDKKRGA